MSIKQTAVNVVEISFDKKMDIGRGKLLVEHTKGIQNRTSIQVFRAFICTNDVNGKRDEFAVFGS